MMGKICSFFSSIFLSLMLVLSPASIYAKTLVLGGQNVGIELKTNGLLVSGTYKFMVGNKLYNPTSSGIRKGDLIVAVDGKSINDVSDMYSVIGKYEGCKSSVKMTVIRDCTSFDVETLIGRESVAEKWKTGLFVKERVLGVGTVTYYDIENNTYGALGHQMGGIDGDNIFQTGNLYESDVKGIRKSKDGDPGEKIATIDEENLIGSIEINNEYGVYGIVKNDISSYLIMDSASQDDVKIGEAYIYTTIDGDKLEKYKIEIVHLKKQKEIDTKGITFKVVDDKLLKKTNGIVAGMSGSPIVQNGKIVGAVTHVLVDNVDYGYGLYIDFMLNQSEHIKN